MVRSLGESDRARVPFALVGVVLLVTSTAFHASLGAAPAVREPATEAALERAGAGVVPALRAAVRRAARTAAADPVVTPANTTVGRALNDSRPFRDALRLRIYLAASDELATVRAQESSVVASAGLPAVDDDRTATVRRAIERIRVRRAGPDGTRLRVHVRNVSLRAARHGRVLTRKSLQVNLTVGSPVLALHDRTVAYERRLDAATLSPRSAGARLTVGTYLVATGRGTAQWAGAPIANVLGNRHLALATDAAVYDAQARTFGTMDPEWADGLATTAARALGKDAVASGSEEIKRGRSATGARALGALERFLLRGASRGSESAGPFETEQVTVRVGRSGDGALAAMLRRPARGSPNLTRVLRESYTVHARLATRTRRLGSSESGRRRPAGGGDWRLVGRERRVERVSRNITVGGSSAAPPRVPGDWHRLTGGRRRVRERATVVRHWRDGNRTRVTRQHTTTRYRVAVAVFGDHGTRNDDTPERAVHPVHDPGGALVGPNLADVPARATEQLVADRGGYGRLAERAVAGTVDTTPVSVEGQRPPRLSRWVESDLRALHRRVRNVSVRTSRRDLGTLDATVAADLAATLRHRRWSLLDAPATYDGASDRARVAARAAYLDRVLARLEGRADRRERARDGLNRSLVSRGLPSLGRIERLRAVAENASTARRGEGQRRSRGVGFVPDATPSRLSLTDISRSEVGLRGSGTVRPLAARNLNVFTLPAGDIASFVRSDGPDHVPLRTAARTLRAAGGGGNETTAQNASLVDARSHLRRAVVASNRALRARIRARLRREGVEGVTERRELVSAGLDPWDDPAGRALALANGSAAEAVARAAVERGALSGRRATSDRLELLLRDELRRALDGPAAQVPRRPTQRTGRLARDLLDAAVTEAVKTGVDRAGTAARDRLYDAGTRTVPAGLPVLPPVQPWYATVNVWDVHVRGTHPSLVVRARGHGVPGPPLAYERDGRPVRLHVDDDGDAERLGRATRVTFDIETAVLVVVPPGGRGVGDTDGNGDERTGWPTPEPWSGPAP
ncbi:DUF7286 family protein [Haloglomus litoreum]|uniref:DUF7286 family protein n=1 Tax=Haloglomus litoreum TaxID=3034026 RepID=UPI0023E7955A|nr:hypothetical protein [Haloglomus sp. DT116]